ncbi:hypothetical protein PVAND_003659 [Polypedilum vanderplanki]|uniref:Dynein regulatory complex protein 1 n=1 Tax=Polypedilum vanderplanki TaxID=319348 RepID=A0A9J6BWJ7_POLVA|nr:hypothetical protein PVAND_003659 [Polypedilum vanderplanki]
MKETSQYDFEETKVPMLKRIVESAILDDKRQSLIQEFLKRKDEMPKLVTEVYEDDKIGIEKQLEDSDKIISQLIQNGNDAISNIRLANDRREVQRRMKEAELRDVLLSDLQQESQQSAAKFEEISRKWPLVHEDIDPMVINEGFEMQKQRINDLINQKMTIINECRNELISADDRYVQDLDKHNSDINCLVERIDKQMEVMKRTYREHLDILEKTIEDERRILQLITTKKWEAMYEKREANEEMRIKREADKTEFYTNEIQRIQLEHEELIRATKIKLENDNQALEIEVQKLKRNIMLNSEKLDYNFQVLKKREDENVMVRNQQKRRLSKLAETIVSLKRKLKEAKSSCITETKKFTADIMKLHAKILDLERKSDLFSEQNNKKFLTVWEINFSECENAFNHILKIDKMLWEQQLGIEWEKPNIKIIRKENLESFKGAMDKLNDSKNETEKSNALVPIKSIESTQSQQKTREQKLTEHKLLRIILSAIADNSGFLIEQKLVMLLMPYAKTEQTLVNLDAVFSALGITQSEEIDFLKEYFAPFTKCKKCDTTLADAFSDEIPIECFNEDHELEITTINVYKALVKFTKDHVTSLDKLMPKEQIESRMSKSKDTISRQFTEKDIEKCFESFVFPTEREKLWNVLEDGLQRYLKILRERENLESECEFLRKQNEELNHLLQKFVPDSFN